MEWMTSGRGGSLILRVLLGGVVFAMAIEEAAPASGAEAFKCQAAGFGGRLHDVPVEVDEVRIVEIVSLDEADTMRVVAD